MRRPALTLLTVLAAAACGGTALAGSTVEHSQDRVVTAQLTGVPAPDGGVLQIALAAEDAQFTGTGSEGYLDVLVEHRGGTSGTWSAGSEALPRNAFTATPQLRRAVLRTVSLPCLAGCTGSVSVTASWDAAGDDLDLGRTHLTANDGPCDHFVVQRVYSARLATGELAVDGTGTAGEGGLQLASRVRATDRSC